ncbi:MAG: division/cell wall cluster transcriptional repressor MraZ [Bilophila sp.]
MLFRGQSYRNLDPKGRLMLPAEFRDVLLERSPEGAFVLTTFDGCIVGYPQPQWLELEEKFSRLRNSSRKIRDFRRLVLGGAQEQTLDPQGRVRLSRAHMEYAGLDHEIIVLGQGSTFEIWDQATFKTLLDQNFDDVADELADSGIDFSF